MTADNLAKGMPKLLVDEKPDLVIWQTGTLDAIRKIEPDDFRTALEEGVETLHRGGADIILMNMQYSPRTETMVALGPYADTMRVVAQQYESRCSTASPSCDTGRIPASSTFTPAAKTTCSLTAFMTVSAARLRPWSSMPPISSRPSSRRIDSSRKKTVAKTSKQGRDAHHALPPLFAPRSHLRDGGNCEPARTASVQAQTSGSVAANALPAATSSTAAPRAACRISPEQVRFDVPLVRTARLLASGAPIKIVALGSSSTYGSREGARDQGAD